MNQTATRGGQVIALTLVRCGRCRRPQFEVQAPTRVTFYCKDRGCTAFNDQPIR